MKKQVFLIIISSLLLTGLNCLGQDYRIGKGDVLKISVYDNPDLEKTVRVSNEGQIVLPLIGTVEADGLTTGVLSQKITALLADGYLVDPHVSVFIEEFRSQKATILGEINSPGLYEISGDISFLELVSKAGGFTHTVGDEAVVERKSVEGKKTKEIVRINLKSFTERGDTSVDVQVIDGDTIFVKKASMFYINGQVSAPDAYKYQDKMTIIKAITLAKGFTSTAAPTRVKIIRKIEGQDTVLEKVKMDEPVLPEDIIVVPESFF